MGKTHAPDAAQHRRTLRLVPPCPSADVPRFASLLPASTASPDATEALGQALAARLHPGDIVAIYGDLGAGKTHLTRGIVRGLGGDPDDVSSPTFALVQTYRAPGFAVHHIDTYRLDGPDAFRAIGGDDLLDDPSAVTVVEWPERIASLLPLETLHLALRHGPGDVRTLEETHG